MRKQNVFNISVILYFILTVFLMACGQNPLQGENAKELNKVSGNAGDSVKKYKVTFIELGSVKCIPCQQMQAVMKAIETKYGNEVKIDFHDVWTDAGKPFGVKYGIEAIPTQIFLDEAGKEYYRHTGFFAEEELVKILQMKGVKAN
jgi:thioredoxin 1